MVSYGHSLSVSPAGGGASRHLTMNRAMPEPGSLPSGAGNPPRSLAVIIGDYSSNIIK
jgi:hypothetical protein